MKPSRFLPIAALLAFGSAHAQASDIRRSFSSDGITHVVVRAQAYEGLAIVRSGDRQVSIGGTPTGGAAGYHPSDPKWKETKPADWGMDFVGKKFGKTLVISTKNETAYIHHRYSLEALTLALPPGIDVTLEHRTLTGEGAPDLSPPREF